MQAQVVDLPKTMLHQGQMPHLCRMNQLQKQNLSDRLSYFLPREVDNRLCHVAQAGTQHTVR